MFPNRCPLTTIISMNARYDPHFHLKTVTALRPLRALSEKILLIGSGGAVCGGVVCREGREGVLGAEDWELTNMTNSQFTVGEWPRRVGSYKVVIFGAVCIVEMGVCLICLGYWNTAAIEH
jgi:hypothetical protein